MIVRASRKIATTFAPGRSSSRFRFDGARDGRGATRREVDHHESEKDLPDALPSYRITQQKVACTKSEIERRSTYPTDKTQRDDEKAVDGGGEQSFANVGFRVMRDKPARDVHHDRGISERECHR